MITYIVVDKVEREEFEKAFQVPYGYGCCEIYTDFNEALGFFDDLPSEHLCRFFIIEKWENGQKEVVFEGKWLLYTDSFPS